MGVPMRKVNGVVAIGVLLLGIALAGWGPMLFSLVSGSEVPPALPGDVASMTSWSGFALLRIFGAALIVLGALLWTLARRPLDPHGISRALAWSSSIGALIALAQAKAILPTMLGLFVVLPFLALAITGWIGSRPASVGRPRSA